MENNDKVQEVVGAKVIEREAQVLEEIKKEVSKSKLTKVMGGNEDVNASLLETPIPILKAVKTRVEEKKKVIKSFKDFEKDKNYRLCNFKSDSLTGLVVPLKGINLDAFVNDFSSVLKTARFNPNAESFKVLVSNVLNSYLGFQADVKGDVIIEEES